MGPLKDPGPGATGPGATAAMGGVRSFFDCFFVGSFFRRYADFGGVCSRRDFWMSVLTYYIVSMGVAGLAMLLFAAGPAGMIAGIAVASVFSLALAVPSWALVLRRLRDAGKSPWLALLGFIPLVGSVILLVMLCLPTQYPRAEEKFRFGTADIGVTAGCLVLMIVGCVFGIQGLWNAANHGYGYSEPADYAAEDYDTVAVEVVEAEEVPVVAVEEEPETVAETETVYAAGGGDAPFEAGRYDMKGNINGYAVKGRFTIRDNGDMTMTITGKYAYDNIIRKYGDTPESYMYVNGTIDSRGRYPSVTWRETSGSDSSFEQMVEGSVVGNSIDATSDNGKYRYEFNLY